MKVQEVTYYTVYHVLCQQHPHYVLWNVLLTGQIFARFCRKVKAEHSVQLGDCQYSKREEWRCHDWQICAGEQYWKTCGIVVVRYYVHSHYQIYTSPQCLVLVYGSLIFLKQGFWLKKMMPNSYFCCSTGSILLDQPAQIYDELVAKLNQCWEKWSRSHGRLSHFVFTVGQMERHIALSNTLSWRIPWNWTCRSMTSSVLHTILQSHNHHRAMNLCE